MRYHQVKPLTALSLAVLLLAACSGDGGGSSQTGGGTDLTMTVWTDDANVIGVYESLAEEFRADNPELGSFTVESIPFNEYTKQLTTRFTGGDAPDLGWVVEATTPAFVEAGALVDLAPQLESDSGYDLADILPSTLTGVRKGDAIYGYPFANTAMPIIFNTDAFAAAGVDSPLDLYERGEWTWENLRRVAREMVESGATTYGFDIPQFQFVNFQQLTPFLNAYDATAWPDGDSCGYASAESAAAFEFIRGMVVDDRSFPGPGSVSSFPTGDTAMYLGAPSTLADLTDATFAFDLVPQPTGVDGASSPFFGQANLAVFARGEDPDLATRLLAYLTTEEASAQLMGFFIPPRESLLTPEQVAAVNPLLTAEAAERSLIDPLRDAEQIPYPAEFPELQAAIKPAMDELWQPGSVDVPAALQGVCDIADPILG